MQVIPYVHACFATALILAILIAGQSYAQEPSAEHDSEATESASAEPAVIDVTVRGAAMPPPISYRDPTVASTVVSGQAIRAPGRSTADVLGNVPGVQLSRTGSGADMATASLRGATSAQTPVMLAGIPLNDGMTGSADLSLVPLWMIDRIEIYRGNAPEFADQFGIGGAVLFEPRLPKKTGFGAGVGVGSFGEASARIAGTLRTKRTATLVGFQHARAHNDYPYTDDNGTRFDTNDDVRRTRDNADFTANDVWAVSRIELGPGSDVTVIGNMFEREQGITGLALIPARHTRGKANRFLGGITARAPCAKSEHGELEGPCLLTLSSAAVLASTRVDDPFREFSHLSIRTTTNATRFTQQGRVRYRIGDLHEVSAFGSQSVERLAVELSEHNGLHASRYTTRAGASATIGLHEGVSLHTVAAVECDTTEGQGSSSTCGVFESSGRFGVQWTATPWLTVLGNVGRYVRPPTLGELYGTSPTIQGTSTLVPEVGVSVDAGVRMTRRGELSKDWAGYVEVFAFARWVDDLIAYRRASFGSVRPFNVGAARLMGVEVVGGAVFLDHFKDELAATFLDPRDTSESRTLVNDILAFRSRMVLSNRFEIFSESVVRVIRLDRVALGILAHHRSSRFADSAGLVVIAPHTTVDFELVGQFFNRTVTLQLAVRNAFNQAQFDTIGYPLPTRSYHASIESWF